MSERVARVEIEQRVSGFELSFPESLESSPLVVRDLMESIDRGIREAVKVTLSFVKDGQITSGPRTIEVPHADEGLILPEDLSKRPDPWWLADLRKLRQLVFLAMHQDPAPFMASSPEKSWAYGNLNSIHLVLDNIIKRWDGYPVFEPWDAWSPDAVDLDQEDSD